MKKIEENRFFNTFIFEGGFWEGSGRVLGRFRKDFEWIFERFWEDIWKDLEGKTMIRATKGISMDGWMDGWMDGEDLIICVAIWKICKFPAA